MTTPRYDVLARLRDDAGRRPADARRPHPGLRLRLRARRGRPGRPRGGGGVRRVQRARPDRVPVAADDGERAGRLRRRLLDAPDDGGRHGHLRRHRVGAARRAGRARRAPGGRPRRGWCCRRPRTRRSTRPPTTSASRRCWCRSARTSAPTRPRWPRRSTTAPCSWWPARRRTRTASSTRSPRSPPRPPARGVRCHVDACIGGWVLPYAARLGRAVPPWTFAVEGVTSISVDLHKYAYAPEGHLAAAAPHARAAAAAVLRERATGPATRCSTRPCSPPSRGGPLAGGLGGREHDRRRRLPDAGRAGVRGRRPARRGHRADPALRVADARTPRWSRSPPTTRATSFTISDEMTAARAGSCSRRCRSPGRRADHPPLAQRGHRRLGRGVPRRRWARRSPAAVAAGPIAIDPGIVEFVAALDPAALTRRRLRRPAGRGRAWAGAAPAVGPPRPDGRDQRPARRRLARLREALLSAFLDRLPRPATVRLRATRVLAPSIWPVRRSAAPVDRRTNLILGKHVTRERPPGLVDTPARRPRLGRGTGAGGRPDRRMGAFLRDEIAAGRSTCRPATTSCRRSSARSPRSRCSWSGRTRTRRRVTRSGSASRWRRTCAGAEEPGQHLHRAGRRPRRRAAGQWRPVGLGRRRARRCSTGASPSRRAAGLAPRQGLGGGHRAGDPRPGRPRWPRWPRSSGVATRRGSSRCWRRSLGRVGAPEPALGTPRLLRFEAVQPGQPDADRAGRYSRSTWRLP